MKEKGVTTLFLQKETPSEEAVDIILQAISNIEKENERKMKKDITFIVGATGSGKTFCLNKLMNFEQGKCIYISPLKGIEKKRDNFIIFNSIESFNSFKENNEIKTEEFVLFIDDFIVLDSKEKVAEELLKKSKFKKIYSTHQLWKEENPSEYLMKKYKLNQDEFNVNVELVSRNTELDKFSKLKVILGGSKSGKSTALRNELLFKSNGYKRIFIIETDNQREMAEIVISKRVSSFFTPFSKDFKDLIEKNSFGDLDKSIVFIDNAILNLNAEELTELCNKFQRVVISVNLSDSSDRFNMINEFYSKIPISKDIDTEFSFLN